MGIFNIEKIFRPKNIAVIGASEKEGTTGNAIVKNLIKGNFPGFIIPVNPNQTTVHELPCIPSIADTQDPIDLAVIAAPIHTVPTIIEECGLKGIGGAIVISAGGKETGEEGAEIEKRIKTIAYEKKVRIIGPNCLGVMSPLYNLNASFAADMPLKGKLAFISQSGTICTAILDYAFQENIGFSYFVSIGSMADVDVGDMIDYLGNDPYVSSILLYVESLSEIRKFMSAARSVSRIKPIVVLKSGRTSAGVRAAFSHTGALAGEDAVYDAAFKRAGIVRVNTIEELFDCAELMAKKSLPKSDRLAIVTNGGGPGVMAIDALGHFGKEPPLLPKSLIEELDEILPPYWSKNNPIDILEDASSDRYEQVIECCMKEKIFDGLLIILSPQALTSPDEVAERLVQIIGRKSYPVFVCFMGGRDVSSAKHYLNTSEIPTYDTPERAVRAFLYMVEYTTNLKMLQEIPPTFSHTLKFDRENVRTIVKESLERKQPFLTETESKNILSAYGIPVTELTVVQTVEEAVAFAEKMGYPLVMKIVSPDITHKTEVDGVQLDLRCSEDVRESFQRIMDGVKYHQSEAFIEGVSLQSFFKDADYEILMGAKKDANFGPVILFGSGGIYTEVLNDRAIALPPLNRSLVKNLLKTTRIYQLLNGYRNKPAADMEAIEEMIIRLNQLLIDIPEIVELDMNPVIVKNGVPCAVDARIRLKESIKRSPRHLSISPYPVKYEANEITKKGFEVFIRPVKPEDAPLFENFFNSLSRQTIFFRFFSYLKELPPFMLVRFTQVDYDRDIGLFAFEEGKDAETLAGVVRIIGEPDGKKGELAIVVGDDYQGKGVGEHLLKKCLLLASERGMKEVIGTVLIENTGMLKLAKKAGFKRLSGDSPGETEIYLQL